MCTYNITLSDSLIERARPAIGRDTDIAQWMQLQMEALLTRLANAPRETERLRPFTMKEIDDMLDEAEGAFDSGDYLTNEDVFHRRRESVAL